MMLAVASLLLLLLMLHHPNYPPLVPACDAAEVPPLDYLSEESIILITGAAGFLGSELALALHRTYNPKKILLIDRLVLGDGTSTSTATTDAGSSSSSSSSNSRKQQEHLRQQEALALFEFQRQRTFHVLQTLGSNGKFYRVDFRPMIPEYYDLGQVPVLDHIFREYDITHVVHFADAASSSSKKMMIIPREKEVPKAGMMEALLEQLLQRQRQGRVVPHFLYASSAEVYPSPTRTTATTTTSNSNKSPLDESKPLSTPTSMHGASKLVDELLAKLYFDMHGIYSVGLRFFPVYGPWSVPGSAIFEMAERAVTGDKPILYLEEEDDNESEEADTAAYDGTDTRQTNQNHNNNKARNKELQDFVYIDDAMDAVMAAMQFRPPVPPTVPGASATRTLSPLPPPVVINVASGVGTSLQQIATMMQEYFPRASSSSGEIVVDTSDNNNDEIEDGPPPPTFYGSTSRAKALLGYEPRVTLREGLEQTLAWHYDRAFPYGGQSASFGGPVGEDGQTVDQNNSSNNDNHIANKGIVSCLPHDKECLRAAPVFPCASECSHEAQCTHSIFDNTIGWTQVLTERCDTVLYTVALDDKLVSLPSATRAPSSESFVNQGRGTCNLAFVSDSSVLLQTTSRSRRQTTSGTMGFLSMIMGRGIGGDGSGSTTNESNGSGNGSSNGGGQGDVLLKHGQWILIPVAVPSPSMLASALPMDTIVWELLPKLSPGLFFARSVQRAIYVDPNIILTSIPKILKEASMQPYLENVQGATALLIGKGKPAASTSTPQHKHDSILYPPPSPNQPPKRMESAASAVQSSAYRMVRIAAWNNKLFGSSSGGGEGSDSGFLTEVLDSRWLVHTLQSEDSRLFRCDVLGEVVQWEVNTDRAALEFILGLHDMWSRVIAKQSGFDVPWWVGDNVITVSEGYTGSRMTRRRLQEEEDREADGEESGEDDDNNKNEDDGKAQPLQGGVVFEEDDDKVEEESGGDENDDETDTTAEGAGGGGGGGFGIQGEQEDVVIQEVMAAAQADDRGKSSAEQEEEDDELKPENDQMNQLRNSKEEEEEDRPDSEDEQPDDEPLEEQKQSPQQHQANVKVEETPKAPIEQQRDWSANDTWMGVLSATSVKYFVRIVPSSEVGVVTLEES
jgi:nucleoside-diphosphate-sugar epimerase